MDVSTATGAGRRAASPENEKKWLSLLSSHSGIPGCVYVHLWVCKYVRMVGGGGSTRDLVRGNEKIPGPTFNNEDYLQQMIKAITWILISAPGSSEGNSYIITVVARIILVHSRSSFWCFFCFFFPSSIVHLWTGCFFAPYQRPFQSLLMSLLK